MFFPIGFPREVRCESSTSSVCTESIQSNQFDYTWRLGLESGRNSLRGSAFTVVLAWRDREGSPTLVSTN